MLRFCVVESKEILTSLDFKVIRTIYQPIIGAKASSMLETLNDFNCQKSLNFKAFELNKVLKMSAVNFPEFKECIDLLCALGLIRRFEDVDKDLLTLKLIKPLMPLKFRENKLLFNLYLKFFTEQDFEEFTSQFIMSESNKTNAVEKTTSILELFNIKDLMSNKKVANPLNIKVPKNISFDDALKKCMPMEFCVYLTEKAPNHSLCMLLENLTKIGFSNQSINLFINYSFRVNTKIIGAHIKKIGEDFIRKGIKKTNDVQLELEAAFSNRNNHYKQDAYSEVEKESLMEESGQIEWDSIIADMGEL